MSSTNLLRHARIPAPVVAHLADSSRWRPLLLSNWMLDAASCVALVDSAGSVAEADRTIRTISPTAAEAGQLLRESRYRTSTTVVASILRHADGRVQVPDEVIALAARSATVANVLVRHVLSDDAAILGSFIHQVSPPVVLAAAIRRPSAVTDDQVWSAARDMAAELPPPPILGVSLATPLKVATIAYLARTRPLPEDLSVDEPMAFLAALAMSRRMPVALAGAFLDQPVLPDDPWTNVMLGELADDVLHPMRRRALARTSASWVLPNVDGDLTTSDLKRLVSHRAHSPHVTGRAWTLIDAANQLDEIPAGVARSLTARVCAAGVLRWVGNRGLAEMPVPVSNSSYRFNYDRMALDRHLESTLGSVPISGRLVSYATGVADARQTKVQYASPVSMDWLGTQLGDDPDRWDLCLSMIDGFDGTLGELIDLIDMLWSDARTELTAVR